MTDGFASILITGASSGLGAGLALAFARPGAALHLWGRNAGRLDEVAERCRARGAEIHAATLDVTDREATAHWVAASEAARPLDLVIANAGISAGTSDGGESDEQARAIFAVNVDGVFNTVLPALPFLRARGRGQVGIMSSLAGFRGFPGAPAYCASKAAVRVWGEALRGELAPFGVGVSVICPGFVADCLETLEEIAIEGRRAFLEAGGREFRYLGCLNEAPTFIEALASIARQHLSGWPTRPVPASAQAQAQAQVPTQQR